MPNDNKYMAKYIKSRYIYLKIRAVEYKGGKCIKCGYNKCVGALQFHHRDPQQKDMDWGFLRKRSWNTIKNELDKCDVLCANCHAEVHYDERLAIQAIKYLDGKKKNRCVITGTEGTCKQCGKVFIRTKWDKNKKYCSNICCTRSQERIKWPDMDDLLKLVCGNGQVQAGKILGVSPQAIKKRIRSYNSNGRVPDF